MSAATHLDRRLLERARLSRDARFDGRFFIAVTSTGIYCRPVCPASPSPKRANVRYFPSAAAAAEAGFRPCLRCRPEAAPGTPAWSGTSAAVRRALRLIQEGALDESSVESLAARVGLGPRHLHRLFVQHLGASAGAVAMTRRLQFAKHLIDDTSLSMTHVALAAGFGSLRRFNDALRKAYGRPPRELRTRTANTAARNADEIVLKLAYRPPYDWKHVHGFLAARAVAGIEHVDRRGYARTIGLDHGHALVHVRPVPDRHELELTVRGASPKSLLQVASAARRVFDLGADPALIAATLKSDPLLGPLVRKRPGLRVPGVWEPFECAVRAIAGQQVTVAAGRTLVARIVARAGRRIGPDGEALTHLFPSPHELAAADLEGFGIPAARIAALKALARAVADRRIDLGGDPDQVVAALAELPGIGSWTAQYIALRALGEPDAFPAADIVLRRMAASRVAMVPTRDLARRAEAWRPWRSYAVLYLWQAATDGASRLKRTDEPGGSLT
jgi:AraC family transcriptional regulator of adaptative response / DNA-3-methyladenine glycosylase II